MKLIKIVILLISLFFLTECRKQTVCPAYSSYFMHDEKYRDEYFTPFVKDTNTSGGSSATNINQSEAEKDAIKKGEIPSDDFLRTSEYAPKPINFVNIKRNGLLNRSATKSSGNYTNKGIPMKFIPQLPDAKYEDTIFQAKKEEFKNTPDPDIKNDSTNYK